MRRTLVLAIGMAAALVGLLPLAGWGFGAASPGQGAGLVSAGMALMILSRAI